MINRISKYWLCQLGGWGINAAITVFFYLTLAINRIDKFYLALLVSVVLGILFTHGMRHVIRKYSFLEKPIRKQIFLFLLVTLIFSSVYALTDISVEKILHIKTITNPNISLLNEIVRTFFNYFFIFLIWNLIYFIFHYVERNTKQEMDTLRLQSLVKELELKTIKSHINPHFIFNALNSIRALVDENPSRARTAITELSNILRSSMQTEKLETVSLETELSIVKDYLALEQMRFEERLKIELEIEHKTLACPVPPMMLQTIAENAIKHGISKKINGGVIKIISKINNQQHELIVQNTGQYTEQTNSEEGFGIRSIIDRLNLVHQGKATFEIKNLNTEMVESKITFPYSN
jgi:two-component system LytT family sensor kinase